MSKKTDAHTEALKASRDTAAKSQARDRADLMAFCGMIAAEALRIDPDPDTVIGAIPRAIATVFGAWGLDASDSGFTFSTMALLFGFAGDSDDLPAWLCHYGAQTYVGEEIRVLVDAMLESES